MSEPTKFLLPEDADPDALDQPGARPPRRAAPAAHPRAPASPPGPEDLTPIFPLGLIAQEVSAEPEVAIPDAVREAYRPVAARRRCTARGGSSRRSGRRRGSSTSTRASPPPARTSPTPRCRRPTRTRRPASSKLATETGAGQWGSVARLRVQPLRAGVRGLDGRLELRPEALPALDDGDLGRDGAPLAVGPHARPAARRPRTPTGSLGIAISEAVEVAAQDPACNYALGLRPQPRAAAPDGHRPGGDRADRAGGRASPTSSSAASAAGRTSAGSCFPFLRRRATTSRFVAAEPAACPTLTRGVYRYDYGDTAA